MADTKDVYFVETGVLLKEDDKEYESYNSVWDKKHSFYDEDQYHQELSNKESMIQYLADYVKNGVPNTYAIVAGSYISADIDLEEGEFVENETYLTEDVHWSIYKDEDGNIHYDFLEGQKVNDADKFPRNDEELEVYLNKEHELENDNIGDRE